MPPSKKGKVVAGQRDRKLDAAFRSTVRSALKGIPVDEWQAYVPPGLLSREVMEAAFDAYQQVRREVKVQGRCGERSAPRSAVCYMKLSEAIGWYLRLSDGIRSYEGNGSLRSPFPSSPRRLAVWPLTALVSSLTSRRCIRLGYLSIGSLKRSVRSLGLRTSCRRLM